ncbi:hypothetical protein GCM10027051_35730 [Niabella terrae]
MGQALFAQSPQIIPKPLELSVQSGNFLITKNTPIIATTGEDRKSAAFLNDYLQHCYGFSLPVQRSGKKGILISSKKGDRDAYTLISGKNGVQIKGSSAAGAFLGLQSLIQLLPTERSQSLSIPAVTITDAPASKYRGLMLDVGRHYFPLSFVKRYIDYIALHKMNYFHWHLTEDQGWRIEIKKYPKLTEVGAWRNGTIVGRFPGTGTTNEKYGGFYTQDEVREIVKYAADRYITVIPEIEMPGHGSAAIAAYPFLSCFPEKATFEFFKKNKNKPEFWAGPQEGKQVMQSWGVYDDIFCAGKESTFEFLQNVLDEVLPLFPSKIVHIGGDEAPKTNWEQCPNCQRRISDLHIKSDDKHKAEHYLQSYFVQRIEKYLNSKGKTLIGWDEILEGGLAPNAWVMSWRGEKGGIQAAKEHHNVIMTPTTYAYIDYQQAPKEDSVTITNNNGRYLDIAKVYSWKLLPDALSPQEQQYIYGGQANLWTEYIDNGSKVEYMIFPRVAAVSEVLWTPQKNKNWEDFSKRLITQKKRYDLWGTNYYGK